MFLGSCASLYSGRDLRNIPTEELKPASYTVTFRFLSISDRGTQGGYLVNKSAHRAEESINYVKKLGVFTSVEEAVFPYESVYLSKGENLEKLLLETIPEIKTDYFIDVRVVAPFMPHGGGLGMWGGLISAISLGIIPSWWHNEMKFEVSVYKNNQKESSFKLEENYHAYHSTLFHLVPSSEYTFRKTLNDVDKNAIRNIVEQVLLTTATPR